MTTATAGTTPCKIEFIYNLQMSQLCNSVQYAYRSKNLLRLLTCTDSVQLTYLTIYLYYFNEEFLMDTWNPCQSSVSLTALRLVSLMRWIDKPSCVRRSRLISRTWQGLQFRILRKAFWILNDVSWPPAPRVVLYQFRRGGLGNIYDWNYPEQTF